MDNNKSMRIITNVEGSEPSKSNSIQLTSLTVSSFAEAKKARDRKKASKKIREYAEQLCW